MNAEAYYVAHVNKPDGCETHFKFSSYPEAAALTALRLSEDFGDMFSVDLCDNEGRYILTIYPNAHYIVKQQKGETLFPDASPFFVAL